MGLPIAPADGIAFAFPNVCLTPVPSSSPVPIPYPNIAQLSDAQDVSDEGGRELLVGGTPVLLVESTVASSSGDEAGTDGGVTSGSNGGECEMTQGSGSVLYGPHGRGIVRFGDPTSQNDGNAVGTVLSANPSVLVGG
ncbi:MAG: DUF4150 domain-containing protein [Gemmatimonadales bacterium]|nr:MAG: DUF4150 domain-containing protein [Gemmatimonadales bacterium]